MWFTLGEDVSEGSEFDCVILHVDVINQCVEVTLESQLIEAVKKRKYHEGTSHKVCVSEFGCVILHVDVINECVEVTLESQLIEAVKKRKYHEGTSHKVCVCY